MRRIIRNKLFFDIGFCHITNYIIVWTTGNGPTLPQHVNEGVVNYGLRSCDVKR